MIPKPRYQKTESGKATVCIDGEVISLGEYGTESSRAKYNELISEWEQELRTVGYTLKNLLPKGDNGRPPSRVTFSRWINRGVAGERLEVVRVGSRVFTNVEMVRDFLTRVTAAQQARIEDDIPEVTEEELAEAGLA